MRCRCFWAEGAGGQGGVAAAGMQKDRDVVAGVFENQRTKRVLGNIKKQQSEPQVGCWVSKN